MKNISLLLFLSFCLVATAQDRVESIDSIFTSLHAGHKFNGNVLIAEKGKVLYKKSFGIANESTGELLTDQSVFELASVSKQFTAMGIVLLRRDGKLKYDDKMIQYLPELSMYPSVTIRQMLNHTSGLPDYEALFDSLYDKKSIATNQTIIDVLSKHRPSLMFEAGTKWEYSNTAYALLATIIERLLGSSYGAFLQKRIFLPLKMKQTLVHRRRYQPKTIPHYAFGYVRDTAAQKNVLPDSLPATNFVIWLDGIVGDGTVNSTVNDLLKWDRALYNEKFLSKEEAKEVFEPFSLTTRKTKTSYGMGWFIETDKICGKIAWHTGGWPGYRTYIERQLEQDRTIIILQNHNSVVTPFADIRKILCTHLMKKESL